METFSWECVQASTSVCPVVHCAVHIMETFSVLVLHTLCSIVYVTGNFERIRLYGAPRLRLCSSRIQLWQLQLDTMYIVRQLYQPGTLCSSESETPPLIWGRSVESVGSKVAQLWEATDGSLPTFLMMLWQVTMAANRYIQWHFFWWHYW